MKKLFTIVALLACFLGAKAETKVDYTLDYSTKSGFPFYVMGYVPEWVDGVMTDMGGLYEYAQEENEFSTGITTTTDGGTVYYRLNKQPGEDGNIGVWHQYFIADGFQTEADVAYTVTVVAKASKDVTFNLQFGNWGNFAEQNVTIPASEEFQEVVWEITGCKQTGGSFMVAQPNTDAVIEWKSVSVSHFEKEEQVEWINILENGDAEGEYGEVPCAYSKEWGTEMTQENTDAVDHPMTPVPHVAPIEDDGGNKVFACHAKAVVPELIFESDGTYSWGATWSAGTSMPHNTWQNQFWIVFPKALKSGEEVMVSFRYKASAALTVSTQYHTTNPGDYLSGGSIGNLDFDTDWKEYSEKLTGSDNWGSIAFNVTGENNNWQSDYDFYFDDLKLEIQKLEEGLFVAGIYTDGEDPTYDYENSISFTQEEDNLWVATIGDENDENTWVNQVMVSTARGTEKGYKANTLKVSGTVVSDEEVWLPYEAAGQAKIDLPVRGVWKISIDTTEGEEQMNFLKLAGDADLDPIDIIMNPAELLTDAKDKIQYAWDNQFWIVANDAFKGSEQTILEFEYCVDSEDAVEAQVGTQWHSATPGDYKGETNQPLTFTNEWQPAKMELNPKSDQQSIAFNMAVEETGYKYKIRNVKWYLKDDVLNPEGQTYKNFINAEGEENFYVKVGQGETYRYDQQPGDEPEYSPYDIDQNGSVNLSDVRKIINKWKAGEEGYNLAFARKAIIAWKGAE